eukprot:17194-Heterococcus_DN1.PRE.2
MPALGSVSDDECDGFEREFSDWSFSSVSTANDNSVRSLKHTLSATYKAGHDAQASAEVPTSKQAQLAAALPTLLLSVKVQTGLACALLLSVYLPDIWIATNVHTEADPVLHTVLIIITIMHLTESIALSYAYSSYFLSRYFCLDLVATLAILLDVSWFTDGWWLNTGYAGLVHAIRATKLRHQLLLISGSYKVATAPAYKEAQCIDDYAYKTHLYAEIYLADTSVHCFHFFTNFAVC